MENKTWLLCEGGENATLVNLAHVCLIDLISMVIEIEGDMKYGISIQYRDGYKSDIYFADAITRDKQFDKMKKLILHNGFGDFMSSPRHSGK